MPSKVSTPKEHAEAAALISWCHRARWRGIALADLLIMIPNGAYLGGARGGMAMAARLRREGFRSGVSDYMLPVPIPDTAIEQPRAGLWLELKRADATLSDLRTEQRSFLEDMEQMGYEARWAKGAEHAETIIRGYLARTGFGVAVGYTKAQDEPFAQQFFARRARDFGSGKL